MSTVEFESIRPICLENIGFFGKFLEKKQHRKKSKIHTQKNEIVDKIIEKKSVECHAFFDEKSNKLIFITNLIFKR